MIRMMSVDKNYTMMIGYQRPMFRVSIHHEIAPQSLSVPEAFNNPLRLWKDTCNNRPKPTARV